MVELDVLKNRIEYHRSCGHGEKVKTLELILRERLEWIRARA